MSQLERAKSHYSPSSIPNMECRALMVNAHEKALRKAGKNPPRP